MKRHTTFGRKQMLLLPLVLSIGMLVAAQVYASYRRPPPPPPGPIISEVFTADIVVHDVTDLYAWQVVVTFDPDVLLVINVTNGDFFDVDFPFFVGYDDSFLGEGSVFTGAALRGEEPGVSGSGTLATIEFGVIGEGSRELQLLNTYENETLLLLYDSTLTEISGTSVTLET